MNSYDDKFNDLKKKKIYDLIEEHYRKNRVGLIKRFRGLAGNRFNSEDIVQEAYTRACQYWSSFQIHGDFDRWFHSILQNCIRDFLKVKNMGALSTEEMKNEPAVFMPYDKLDLEYVLRRIREKPKHTAYILQLYLVEGYNSLEISQLVPEKRENVRKIVERFRKELRE